MKFARLHFGKAAQQFLLVPHRDGGERALNAETFHTATRRMEGRKSIRSKFVASEIYGAVRMKVKRKC